jgi:hypothetical protein
MSKDHQSVGYLTVGLIAATLGLLLLACSNAKIAGRQDIGTLPTTKPSIVYVADFELDAESIQSEPTLLPRPRLLSSGPLGALLPGRFGASGDPALRARELVDLMAASLVKDLGEAGVKARRLEPGESAPSAGWLVRGLFTQVDEGNRLRRAVIGFGEGQTQLQLSLAVDDLAQGQPQPFYQLTTDANSGKLPGAAVTLNPIAMGARFVLSRNDLERNVSETAAKIAGDLAARVRD